MRKWFDDTNLLENVTKTVAEYEPEAKNDEKIVACFPPFLLKGGWTTYPIFKKGGLIGTEFLEGSCWERSG